MRNTHRIWIAGANGRLGQAIYKLLDLCEYEVLNTDIEDVDITDAEEVITFSDRNRFDIIVNCAGMTDLDECEKNLEMAYKVNAGLETLVLLLENMIQRLFIFQLMMYSEEVKHHLTQSLIYLIQLLFMVNQSWRVNFLLKNLLQDI